MFMAKQHVLGEGYIWFVRHQNKHWYEGYDGLRLVTEADGTEPVKLDVGELGAYQRVRIIAVPISDNKKKGRKK